MLGKSPELRKERKNHLIEYELNIIDIPYFDDAAYHSIFLVSGTYDSEIINAV